MYGYASKFKYLLLKVLAAPATPAAGTIAFYVKTGGIVCYKDEAGVEHVLATMADVLAVIDSAPGALDTLNELAAALGDDSSFATTMTNALAAKASIVQVQNDTLKSAVAGGTADALTATLAPVPTLVDLMRVYVRAGAANATTTPTLNVNGTGALTITKQGGQALAAGDIAGAGHELTLVYRASVPRWELLNPAITGGGSFAALTGVPSDNAALATALGDKLDDSQLDTDATMAANSDAKIATQKAVKTALATKVNTADVGAAGGVAPLDGSGKIASTYLPSYVDDVIEVADFASLPVTGETGKIYVTLDNNKQHRWSGSAYITWDSAPGTTDALVEGATNLYFTAARVRAVVLTGLSTATNAVIDATDTVLGALGKLQAQITGLWAGWGAQIAAGTDKATPVDADEMAIADSAASSATKKVSIGSIKTVFKTYFDTLYQTALGLTANTFYARSSAGGAANKTITDLGLNLLDDVSQADMRTTIGAAVAIDVQTFAASGNWTPPAGAVRCFAIVIGAGGGGGSGRRGAAGTVRCGGGAGGSGGRSIADFHIANLTVPVAITIGAGGAGGAAKTTDDTNGSNATDGGNSSFGTYLTANGGGGGNGGTATTGAAGNAGNALYSAGSNGAAANTSGAAGTAGSNPLYSSGGGGSGGGITVGDNTSAGGAGRGSALYADGTSTYATPGAAGAANGGNGGNGAANTALRMGSGGGGGGSSKTSAAGAGGNGGGYGAGGGGGGASLNGFNSGAGGTGSDGYVIVVSY